MIQNPSFEEFKGYTQKQKTLDEIYNYIEEDRINQHGYKQNYLPLSLITVFDPKTAEITNVGCSVPNDIVNDNFGLWLAGILSPSGFGAITLKDITNTSRNLNMYSGNASVYNQDPAISGPYATKIQVGTGTTTPVRTDLDIETSFANGGPEDSKQDANNGSYVVSNSTVQVGIIITPTAAAGTVRESCLFCLWRENTAPAGAFPVFLLSRDLVGVGFLIGQSISVSYIWNL